MRCLVTGGAGYIGSVLTKRLIEDKQEVVVADNLSTGFRENIDPRAEFKEGDLRDRRFIRSVLIDCSIDIVFHLAGLSVVEDSERKKEDYVTNNMDASYSLINQMMIAEIPNLIFSSSAAIYGNPKETPITELSIPDPVSFYGETKLRVEDRINAFRLKGLNAICLRYFNAAGSAYGLLERHSPETHVLPILLEAAKDEALFHVNGKDFDTPDGTAVRDYVHVADLAEAHLDAMNALRKGVQGSFNLGTGTGYSVLELAKAVEKVTGKKLKLRYRDRREGDPAKLVASNSEATKKLRWQPAFGLHEIVESVWDAMNSPAGV